MQDTTSTEPKQEAKFQKAKDSRGREIEGLWVRNGRFYCQTRLPGKACTRVPLYDDNNQPVSTVQQAQEAAALLKKNVREGELPTPRHAPFFSDYVKHYCAWMEETEAKDELTVEKERLSLNKWAAFFGQVRVNHVKRSDVNNFLLERKQKDGVSNRTLNLDVIALRHLLAFAKDEGWIKGKVATDDFKWLKHTPPKRTLKSPEELEKVCAELLRKTEDGQPVYRNGQAARDWLQLMATSGGRRTATLSAKWSEVNFERKQITLHTKRDKTVIIDFNERLEALLKDMHSRRLPDCAWLFPSPREDGPGHLVRLYNTLDKAMEAVGVHFTPHDMRHFFISYCVMSGLDFKTIAEWVGHNDGGVLIGKVYGHLNKEHLRRAATKVSFSTSGHAPSFAGMSADDLLNLLQQKMQEQAKAA